MTNDEPRRPAGRHLVPCRRRLRRLRMAFVRSAAGGPRHRCGEGGGWYRDRAVDRSRSTENRAGARGPGAAGHLSMGRDTAADAATDAAAHAGSERDAFADRAADANAAAAGDAA